jgi:multicomponent Na+:H+ antiporter subunit D
LFNHGITKGALFLLAGGVSLRCGGTSFAAIAGLGQRMPLTSFGIVIAGLSLIGVPATAGFTTKWYLVVGALERGYWWLAALIVVSSLIAVAYVWRFVEAAYLQAPGPEAPRQGEMPLSMLLPAWLMVGACIYFGIWTSFNIGFAGSAAELLLHSGR